jgi:GNAT superfamily N-acetyltransferase
MADVRPAVRADLDTLGRALARAFFDDPVMEYLVPEKRRERYLHHFFVSTAVRNLDHGQVWTTDDLDASALWAAPDQWRVGFGELGRMLPATLRTFGSRLPRALGVLSKIERVHPKEPHWYLGVLGTDPPRQGKGLGSAVLQPVLERCDHEGLPAYLESSKERNVPFYSRHGFEVTNELKLGDDGPPLWTMWREPRA